LETGSYLVLRAKGLPTDSSLYREIYNRAATGLDSWHLEPHRNEHTDVRRLEPYFGYGLTAGNNYGFLSTFDFPYRKKPSEFVVGIFGGSTAMHWADFLDKTKFWDRLKISKYPEAKVVVVNLALAGMHQPQQLYVANKFIDGVDLALVLDGWNETQSDNCPSAPPEFPQDYQLLFQSEKSSLNIALLRLRVQKFRRLSTSLERSPFASSRTLFLIWNGIQNGVRNRYQQVKQLVDAKSDGTDRFASECSGNQSERVFENWKKYTLQMMALGNFYGIPIYQFLQPTPYLPDAKPLGDEEKRLVNWDLLKASGETSAGTRVLHFRDRYLKAHITHTTDLSFIFKNEARSTYVDQYTHLNELGYKLLTKAVESRLREDGIIR
jgi:hypothetical protein